VSTIEQTVEVDGDKLMQFVFRAVTRSARHSTPRWS
jgi:hypothetical protein